MISFSRIEPRRNSTDEDRNNERFSGILASCYATNYKRAVQGESGIKGTEGITETVEAFACWRFRDCCWSF